jgi:branched-chain amino acid transport system permease protein
MRASARRAAGDEGRHIASNRSRHDSRPAGAIAAVVAAAAISVPVLRLKGIYVVLVTFAFGQLCLQVILSQSGITGGRQGMVGLPSLRLGDINLARNGAIGYYYIGLGLLAVSTLFPSALGRIAFRSQPSCPARCR